MSLEVFSLFHADLTGKVDDALAVSGRPRATHPAAIAAPLEGGDGEAVIPSSEGWPEGPGWVALCLTRLEDRSPNPGTTALHPRLPIGPVSVTTDGMAAPNTKLTTAVETYLTELRHARASGGATGERSSYPALAGLLTAVGATLKPKVICVSELADQGAGHPDFGLYAAKQVQKGQPKEGQVPERGVVEVKSAQDDACQEVSAYASGSSALRTEETQMSSYAFRKVSLAIPVCVRMKRNVERLIRR